MLFFLVYILFVIICPSNVTNVLIYFCPSSYATLVSYYFGLLNTICYIIVLVVCWLLRAFTVFA